MKKYMREHTSCPYYSAGTCSRTGCSFLTPCTCINEPRGNRVFVKITRKGNTDESRRKR